jgi:dienelactone hydrolase
LRAAWQSASDLSAAIEAMRSRTDVSTNSMIAVGVSAGGFASLALTANAPPPQLRDEGRAGFADYLTASPHRAFAVSPKGAFAFRSGRRSTREAAEAVLTACAEYAPDCALYAVDDHLADSANAGSR